jgi:cytoskeletal protein CcmA (bactofilin family)
MMQLFGSRRKTNEDIDSDTGRFDAQAEPSFPSPTKQSLGFDTVLGAGSRAEGTLQSEGNIRLDGSFSGTLDIQGNILIGENARIEADVEARNISIAGEVRGNISGNRVQILSTGRIIGDITARTLTTEEGAYIDGKVAMAAPEPVTAQVEQQEEEVVEQAVAEVELESALESALEDDETDD